MVYFQVVIYERKMFIRLATGLVVMGGDSSKSNGFCDRNVLGPFLYKATNVTR